VWRGAADLVWEKAVGLIIVDYKSYLGKKEYLFNPIMNIFNVAEVVINMAPADKLINNSNS
jgi:hypothetical protein